MYCISIYTALLLLILRELRSARRSYVPQCECVSVCGSVSGSEISLTDTLKFTVKIISG